MFKAHTASVRCVDFAKDGQFFLTSSDDKTVKVCTYLPFGRRGEGRGGREGKGRGKGKEREAESSTTVEPLLI